MSATSQMDYIFFLVGWAATATFVVFAIFSALSKIDELSREVSDLRNQIHEDTKFLNLIKVATGHIHMTNGGRVLRLKDMTLLHLFNLWKTLEHSSDEEKRGYVEEELRHRARDGVEYNKVNDIPVIPVALLPKWDEWTGQALLAMEDDQETQRMLNEGGKPNAD